MNKIAQTQLSLSSQADVRDPFWINMTAEYFDAIQQDITGPIAAVETFVEEEIVRPVVDDVRQDIIMLLENTHENGYLRRP